MSMCTTQFISLFYKSAVVWNVCSSDVRVWWGIRYRLLLSLIVNRFTDYVVKKKFACDNVHHYVVLTLHKYLLRLLLIVTCTWLKLGFVDNLLRNMRKWLFYPLIFLQCHFCQKIQFVHSFFLSWSRYPSVFPLLSYMYSSEGSMWHSFYFW